jgi:hypothetical protein
MIMSLTPDKKEGLKQMTGQYSGKASLSEFINKDYKTNLDNYMSPIC